MPPGATSSVRAMRCCDANPGMNPVETRGTATKSRTISEATPAETRSTGSQRKFRLSRRKPVSAVQYQYRKASSQATTRSRTKNWIW